jgi:hypothetical protein
LNWSQDFLAPKLVRERLSPIAKKVYESGVICVSVIQLPSWAILCPIVRDSSVKWCSTTKVPWSTEIIRDVVSMIPENKRRGEREDKN